MQSHGLAALPQALLHQCLLPSPWQHGRWLLCWFLLLLLLLQSAGLQA
jgi:hypothetical protein